MQRSIGKRELRWEAEASRWRAWLFDVTLPLWWEAGANRGAAGGFHDRLQTDGQCEQLPFRLRVQARQVFVYAEAGRWGWTGPWQTAVEHGLAAVRVYRQPDGFYAAAVNAAGAVVSNRPDLYDQAFVLLALASGWRALGQPPALLHEAETLLSRLERTLRHPLGGFEEGSPRVLPLRSNPHMHLLEAMIAWIDAGVDSLFAAVAREVVQLALDRFIDPKTGAVGEFFAADWRFACGAPGQVREPGHQFEWAYLLERAGLLLGMNLTSTAEGLYRFGTRFGVKEGRVIGAVDAAGYPVDRRSRLWQQTERLRAALFFCSRTGLGCDTHVIESLATLPRFLRRDAPGHWYDVTTADGVAEPASSSASSLYHIMTGLHHLVGES